jgi:hypothetical protein
MTLNLAADAPLLQAFATLPDPRKSRNQVYPLNDIIAAAIIGILCSGNVGCKLLGGPLLMKIGSNWLVFVLMEFHRMT